MKKFLFVYTYCVNSPVGSSVITGNVVVNVKGDLPRYADVRKVEQYIATREGLAEPAAVIGFYELTGE